jgi:hypothetical protein
MTKSRQQTEITVLSEILRHFRQEGHTDHDNYGSRLAATYVDSLLGRENCDDFCRRASKIRTNYFKANRTKKLQFLVAIYGRLGRRSITAPEQVGLPPLSLADIFPEILLTADSHISNIDEKLDLDETVIQNALRAVFREKGAAPIPRKFKDSPLEVADIEHFNLKMGSATHSFTIVVKGLNSLGKKRKVNWEDIAHQVTKAYNTQPDYVIVATAAEPVDRLITEMTLYAKSVGKPNLIVFVPPMDLAKFLIWRRIIKP